MRALLVKFNYGLEDLSYIELGECGSMQGGVHHDRGRTRKPRTTVFYMEWFDVDEHRYKLTYIPMHVHKLEDGVKLGAPCSREHCLVQIFSIGKALSSGEFVLKPNEKFDPRFCVTVQINRREVFSLHQEGSLFRLKHGDIIEFFLQEIRLKFSREKIATRRSKLRTLHLIDFFIHGGRRGSSNVMTFPDFLGCGELRSLHANDLPFKLSNDDWLLAQRRGTFADLELLTLRGGKYDEMPLADMMCDAFPKLKSIWFQNLRVSPTTEIDHILEMPSLEKLWFRNVRSEVVPEPIPHNFFDRRPKEWLENIKLISADKWERYIPYSRLINLELVAFFSRYKTTGVTDVDGTLPRSLENIFEELRNCSKLKGLILRIPDGFRCAVLGELSQKLEFAAISGANSDEVKYVLECLSSDQTRLEELWIRVFNTSDFKFEEITKVLMRFKRLKEVVFVYTPCPPSKRSFDNDDAFDTDEDSDDAFDSDCVTLEYRMRFFERVLREFADPGCSWKQATYVYDGPYLKQYFTYSFKLRRKTEFSSFAVSKFFSEWFRHVSDGNEDLEFRAADLISALFPKQTE
ncbi:unnamed protein product [Notodromas monacha]|uniref:Uncharacterized protein n=1 Tax=Notodromas monacha TaxID=399045 RepID=A0A7R9GB55_9CRUS|nr:unnamed protein product [Notodromas monacha]CAG0914675.1 unnamed protein product [Notodromas monacha]